MGIDIKKISDYSIRLYLSISIFSYSIAKIFGVQFSKNYDYYLNNKISELSGQDLVWVFFGYSKNYELFIGIIQLLGVILLARNKTKILGIIILCPILINILLIDGYYGVNALNYVLYYLLLTTVLIVLNMNQIHEVFKKILDIDKTGIIDMNFPKIIIILTVTIILFLVSWII
jgi:hypothetical protein